MSDGREDACLCWLGFWAASLFYSKSRGGAGLPRGPALPPFDGRCWKAGVRDTWATQGKLSSPGRVCRAAGGGWGTEGRGPRLGP